MRNSQFAIRNSQFHECVHRHHMLDKLVITKTNYFMLLMISHRTILSFGITLSAILAFFSRSPTYDIFPYVDTRTNLNNF